MDTEKTVSVEAARRDVRAGRPTTTGLGNDTPPQDKKTKQGAVNQETVSVASSAPTRAPSSARRKPRRKAVRLFRTTAFRFTAVYVIVFAGAVSALGAYFYGSTFTVVDRQTENIIDQDLTVLAEVFEEEGPGTLRRLIRERAAWRDNGVYILVGEPSGAVLAGNLTALPLAAKEAREDFFNFTYQRPILDAAGRQRGEETRRGLGKLRRFRTSANADTSFLVFIARDITGHEAMRDRSRAQIARIGAATIALGLLIGLGFSRSLLQRVESVSKTAKAIQEGDLSRRIRVTGSNDELDHLSKNLNAMLDRIERLMIGMRDVSDNIAHDLRSPLTRIRARLDDAVNADIQTKEAALVATREDAERMIVTFNALLAIARIESGEGAGEAEIVDLSSLIEEMAELYEPAVQDAGFSLQTRLTEGASVRGSRALLGQALANMLDNALKYAVGGSVIRLTVAEKKNGLVLLSVEDDGPGIPEAERENVLKRFVRLEESRTSEGSGLGLSLVAALAHAMNAKLSLSDSGLINPVTGKAGLRIQFVF
ncbi:MAG: ATP-binding protein, partial [Pseudomonadota bacterium]